MKRITLIATAFIFTASMIACGGAEKKETETVVEEQPTDATPMAVDVNTAESKVYWYGSVLGMHSHNGSVDITEASLEMTGDAITGGNFTIDMTSINPMDSSYSEDKTPEMLVGHLSSGDFFLVDSFPTATFVIKSSDMANNTVTGDLTIRGTTKEETIENVMINKEAGEATGSITIDRQDYGVAFKHPMEDVVISDDIELDIKLKM